MIQIRIILPFILFHYNKKSYNYKKEIVDVVKMLIEERETEFIKEALEQLQETAISIKTNRCQMEINKKYSTPHK